MDLLVLPKRIFLSERFLRVLLISVVAVTLMCGLFVAHARKVAAAADDETAADSVVDVVADRFRERRERMRRVCAKYADPFRPESAAMSEAPRNFGSEVVFLRGPPRPPGRTPRVASVCVPHKVGSHAWGKFAKQAGDADSAADVMSFAERARTTSVRVVVARHPLERLVSVFRMIFEDWCEPDRFLAKQWDNVCSPQEEEEAPLKTAAARKDDSLVDVGDFLATMLDEHRFGNDRYIRRIWQRFHPGEELRDPRTQLRFSFREFVRFLVNGSAEFGLEVTRHVGLSYHWAPYWRECALCSELTRPDLVVHMETFAEDLGHVLADLGLEAEAGDAFPHTHEQRGGHSSEVAEGYFATLTREEVRQLVEMYRLDLELFGYDAQPYLDVALRV